MKKVVMEDIKFKNHKISKQADDFSHTIRAKNFEIPKKERVTTSDRYFLNKEKEEGVLFKEDSRVEENIRNRNLSRKRIGRTPRVKTKSKTIHGFTITIFILCILGGGTYWGGEFFHSAKIEIKQKVQDISYENKAFSVSKNSEGDSDIKFEIYMKSTKKIKPITLKDTKEVSQKSKGTVIFYNEFSTLAQNISAGSFLSDDEGKSYKLDKSITIPGYKLDKDKKITPGSVSADITAFLPGDAYNGSPTKFYVNSFSRTDKYNKIYAKLKSPLVGGASGTVYVLNDEDKKIIEDSISDDKDYLVNQARYEMKPGYILYSDASNFSYKIDENVMSKTEDAKVEVEEDLSAVIFDRESLVKNIIKTSIPNVTTPEELKEIKIEGLDKLAFTFNPKDLVVTKDLEKVDFSLDGKILAVWQPDLEILKSKLIGVDKGNVSSIFKQDKGISSAVVKIFPLWKKNIPSDLSKINLFNSLTQ